MRTAASSTAMAEAPVRDCHMFPGFAPAARSPSLRSTQRTRRRKMANGSLTWLGHASFRLDTPGGKRVYIDPWLENPKCPESEQEPERVDLIALTHGHGDHVGDTVELWKKFKPPGIAVVELRAWLPNQGGEADTPQNPNKGGTIDVDGVKVTMTDANHSSSTEDGTYAGE